MKKLLIWTFFVAACVCAALPAQAELKIATVDLVMLVRNHPDYARNEKYMEAKSKDLQKKGDEIKSEGEKLQEEGKKLVEQLRNPMLNDRAKAETEKKIETIQAQLMKIEQRYRNEMMRGNQDLQEDRARLMKLTTDDLRARVRKYAEEQGYDLVLDSNAVAFAKEAFDVTDAMLVQMGVDPKQAKGVEKDAANEGK